jgi:riboflavin kinase / FMN adenylyltransferase
MQIIKGAESLPLNMKGKIYLALGNFDGVHIGHQAVISKAVAAAKKNNGISAALIFDPHPAKVINPAGNLQLLSDIELKAELFKSLGLDCMIVEKFNQKVAELTPEMFVNNFLWEKIKVRGVTTGFDYTFGRKASGHTDDLREFGNEIGFEVEVCPPVKVNETLVSSSLIRRLITEGEVEEASELLNYYYSRRGTVVAGDGRGKTLGYPTANIDLDPCMIRPGSGVYFTAVKIDGRLYYGAANIGRKPTFSSRDLTVEVNIMDYNGDLYGEILRVYFIKKIREEIAFTCAEELKKQLAVDVEQCRRMACKPLKGLDSEMSEVTAVD